jgi:multimeric flavodoxin WrbA
MSGVRFVALNGSERAQGTTAACLDRARTRLEAQGCPLEVIHLSEHDIRPCRCGRCNSRPDPCPVQDDVGGIVARMKDADAIVYAAPVHGFGLASVMQLFLERAGVGHLRFERPLTNRVGGAVVVGRRYSHAMVHAQLIDNLMLNRMILAGSGFPALIQAGGPTSVDSDVEGLDAMYRMLDRMVELAMTMRGGRRAMAVPASVELRDGVVS